MKYTIDNEFTRPVMCIILGYLHIAAIVFFTATLIKLFFFDISHLDTISKTIVFISLGVLLLSISFLYTKYREVLSGD